MNFNISDDKWSMIGSSWGIINHSKKVSCMKIPKSFIYFAYDSESPLSASYLRGMYVFLVMNLIASFLFWTSYLSGSSLNFYLFSVNAQQETLLTSFILYFQNVLLITFPVLLIWPYLEKLVVPNCWSFLEIPPKPESNPINDVYLGKKKTLSFIKGGIFGAVIHELLLITFIVCCLYFTIPLFYLKFFNTDLFNLIANFQAQGAFTLLIWNFVSISFYQFLAGACLPLITNVVLLLFVRKEAERIYCLKPSNK